MDGGNSHYLTVSQSDRASLLVAADRARVEAYTREEPGWRLLASEGLEAHVLLPALGITLALADIYDLVAFDAGEATSAPRS